MCAKSILITYKYPNYYLSLTVKLIVVLVMGAQVLNRIQNSRKMKQQRRTPTNGKRRIQKYQEGTEAVRKSARVKSTRKVNARKGIQL